MKRLTICTGKVEAVLVGMWQTESKTIEVDSIKCFINEGIKGDKHSMGRLGDAREDAIKHFGLPKDIQVANMREFSAISVEELEEISKNMSLPERIPFGCLGENIVISGIGDFSKLPPNTQLFFETPTHQKRACSLLVCDRNNPCLEPGKNIAEYFADEKLDTMFPKAAMGRRGLVGIVYTSGKIKVGDKVFAYTFTETPD